MGRRAASPALGFRPVSLIGDARRVTGGRRSPPLLQSRPRHPRPVVCSLPGLKAEATPGCGQFSTQRTAGQGRRPQYPRRPVRTSKSSFPAHLESAAPTRPAWPLSDPKMSARPQLACLLLRLSLQCSRPAPPRSQLRLRARFQRRLQIPTVPAAFKLTHLSALGLAKLQLPTAFKTESTLALARLAGNSRRGILHPLFASLRITGSEVSAILRAPS